MFKRILICALAATLVFDSTAVTTLAASTQTEVVSEVSSEETVSGNEVAEEADTVSGNETAEEAEKVAEETAVSGNEAAAEETETGSEIENVEETVKDTETVSGNETVEESETVSGNENVEETDSEESVTEDNVAGEEEAEQDGKEKPEEDAGILVADSDRQALTLDTVNTVNLPARDDNWNTTSVYVSFTAPEAGYYNFHADKNDAYDSNIYFYLYKENGYNSIGSGSVYRYSDLNVLSGYLAAGETVYGTMYSYNTEDVALELTVQKLDSYSLAKQTDGSYQIATEDYIFTAGVEVGHSFLRNKIKLEAQDGVTLDSSYYVYVYADNGADTWAGNFYLSSYNSYSTTNSMNVAQGSTYNVYYTLVSNDTGEILGVFADGPSVTTSTTDQSYYLHNTIVTESSITFDIENFDYVNCYYAPVDGSVAERYMSMGYGWNAYTFDGLKPGTEYYFAFVDSSSKQLFKLTASTAATTSVIDYDAYINESGYLEMKADVSGYTGNASYAYLYYEYVDALGRVVDYYNYVYLPNVEADENGAKSFTCTATDSAAFLAGTTYDIKLRMEFGSSLYGETVKQVTTAASTVKEEDVTFTVSEGTTSGIVDYSIAVAGIEGTVNTYLFYKEQGDCSNNYSVSDISVGADGYTGSISYLQAGATYEFTLIVGGVMKQVIITAGEADAKLTAVGDAEVNAFDITRTFKVESEAPADTYYLRLYYMPEGYDYYMQWDSYKILTADNSYQVEFKTADAGDKLSADTEYNLKWTLSTYSYGSPVYTVYETVNTEAADITTEVTRNSYNKQSYKLTLDADSVANFSYFSLPAYVYIRKQGENNYRQANYIYLYANSSSTLELYGLEAETTYDVSLRNDNDYKEIKTFSFTTAKDTRKLEVTSEQAYFHSVRLYYTVSGVSSDDYTYVHFYIREKGTDGAWERANYNSNYGSYNSSFWAGSYNGAELKENTTYEYQIGFANNYDSTVSTLEKVLSGEFKTAEDTRTVTTGVSAGYTQATIGMSFSGNDTEANTCIHSFYRLKGVADWTHNAYFWISDKSYTTTMSLDGLKPGTAYEYAVLITDSYEYSNPDSVTDEARKVVGEFSTKDNAYNLTFKADEASSTYAKEVVTVTAKDCTNDDTVTVGLTLSDVSGNDVQHQTVTLKRGNGYTAKVTFTGLMGSTKYVISEAGFSVVEDGEQIDLGTKTYDYAFTTKEAVVPTSITLSDKEITLNAMYSGDLFEGVNSKTLTAKGAPSTAAQDFVWTTDCPFVASVYDDGTVFATGCGEAVITVASAYDSSVTASCKVTVKKYAIGYTSGDGVQLLGSAEAGRGLYKGESLEGYGLYEVDENGNATLLENYTVTPARQNIVTWKDGKLQAIGTGYTRVDFAKDGVIATMYVNVQVKPIAFDIKGFTSSNSNFPAVKTEEGYTLVWLNGVNYTAVGVTSPASYFNAYRFKWSSSDTSVATVDEYGVITPVGQGTTTLTVESKAVEYADQTVTVELTVKGLPSVNESEVLYAVSNVDKKLSDVEIPDTWAEGWEWKNPSTPLVINGVNQDYYEFDVVYKGDQCYPREATISVYISKITGLSVNERYDDHNQILVADGSDSMRLAMKVNKQGTLSSSAYTIEVPEVEGLTVSKNSDGTYNVTASKAGKYTLKPVVKVDGTVVATGKYAITAVNEKQAASIALSTNTDGVTITGNQVIFESEDAKKNFDLTAVVKDRNGDVLDTQLTWKTSDKSVATVTAGKNTQTATVAAKGAGHAVITVTAKDKTGYQVTLDVEIQNHKPRVNTSKATVNVAYDYDNYYGQQLASAAGLVEIVPVYGEWINNVQLFDKTGETLVSELRMEQYGENTYLVVPSDAQMEKTGTYNCTMRVTTSVGKNYDYSLKVTVQNKKPTVSAKMSSAINLFFTELGTSFNVKTSNNARIRSITWEDKSTGVGNGFRMSYGHSSGKPYINVYQEDDLAVVNGKLQDTNVTKGKLSIKLRGYKATYTFEDFAIKYTYKKPNIVSMSASTTIAPDLGQNGNGFYMYDKTNKRYVWYSATKSSYGYFNELSCADEDVTFDLYNGNSYVDYYYNGDKSSNKITMVLDCAGWRESVNVTHTIKVTTPKAYLYNSTITFNPYENAEDNAYTDVRLSNSGWGASLTDLVVKGANATAQKLIDKDLLVFTTYGNGISVEMSDAAVMDSSISAGSYKYKVTPYYTNSAGVKKTMNTLTLTVKIVKKATTAKITPSGSIDLAKDTSGYREYYYGYNKLNSVWVNPKFSNLPTGHYVSSYKLVGEYSDYFTLGRYGNYYIKVNDECIGSLKAGQAYKLAVQYTIRTDSGAAYTITSNTFTIKPKQSAPKVTVSNNNQTLYAAANSYGRYYYLSTPAYYEIESAYGSIDCNKDGVADIVVSGDSSLYVRITDRDGVVASASGKTYTIPVTVKVVGRDGISKDAKVSIKVKVKR